MAEKSTSIKDRIIEIARYKGVNIESFLEGIGQTYGNYKGKSKLSVPSADVIAEISAKHDDININWVLTGEGEMVLFPEKSVKQEKYYTHKVKPPLVIKEPSVYKLRTDHNQHDQVIPLYNLEATAGLVELFRDHNDIDPIDNIHIPNLPKCDGAVFVAGDSMYPLLKSGDIVMYKKVKDIQNDIFWGQMYLISIASNGDEFVMVKYIQKSEKGEGYVTLVSENRHHQDKDVKIDKIRALALIKGSVRINTMS